MLSRLELLIGSENLNKLSNTRVLVIGCGGVGGYVVEALARSGIGTLILYDPDMVEESNINRQIVALKSTIGKYKVDVLKERIEDMGLNTKVYSYREYITENNIYDVIKDIDYVVDACDMVSAKIAIIEACIKNNIHFISSMGTGNKLDPSKLEIVELSKTSYDPLAKVIRKLVKEKNIKGKIMVVSSKENTKVSGSEVIPSTSFVPASAGILCASYIVNQIVR